jgi:hypothetical protein
VKITHAILWNGKQVNTAISLAMAKQTKAGMERDYGPLPKGTLTIRKVS